MFLKHFLNHFNHRSIRILPKIFKPVFIILLIIGVFFLAKTNFAQTTSSSTSSSNNDWTKYSLIKQKQDAIKKGNNQESLVFESISTDIVTFITVLVGEVPDSVLQGKNTSWTPSGMIGQANKLISFTFYQPVSGIQYISQIKDNFLSKPTYAAQGIGYDGLSTLIPIWRTLRNTVYILFSIAFVCIGIAIMLRVKISPQAVITIQNAIPKLITSLILVTFSYAIAGLLIDLSYFVQGLFANILFKDPNIVSGLTKMDMVQTITRVQMFMPTALVSLLGGLISTIFANSFSTSVAITTITIGAVLDPGLLLGGLIFAALGAGVLNLILSIVIFFLIIKFFIGLIKCYFSLILKIIMGPLEIGMGAIPNSKIGFGSWFIGVVSNLAVFPICALYLIFVNLIIATVNGNLWLPSMLNISFGGSAPSSTFGGAFGVIFAIGAILLLPKLPTMIPEFIFSIKPSPWGKAIGEGLKEVPGRKLVQQGTSLATEAGLKTGGAWAAGKMGYSGNTKKPVAGSTGAGGTSTTPPPISS